MIIHVFIDILFNALIYDQDVELSFSVFSFILFSAMVTSESANTSKVNVYKFISHMKSSFYSQWYMACAKRTKT